MLVDTLENDSGQKTVLACAARLRAPTILIQSTVSDFQLHWLIPPGDAVGVMSNQVTRRDQTIVKKMDYFKNGGSLNGTTHSVTYLRMAQIQKVESVCGRHLMVISPCYSD